MAKKNPYLNDRDILDQALEHSWGKTADAKAKEKAYNREYYQRHKEEILRKARQAGEGIQREARGIKEAITGTSRRYPSNKELHSNYPDTRTTYGYGPDRYGKDAYKSNLSNRRRLEEAKSDYDRYRNTPGASQTKERVRKAASKHSSTAAAINEREKAYRQVGPESKFDSKLVRDAQNAYSKVRPGLRKAKNAVSDTMNKAKNAYDQAKLYVGTATNPMGRHPGEHAPSYSDVERYNSAHVMNKKLANEANERVAKTDANLRKADSRLKRIGNAIDSNYKNADREFRRSNELSNNPNTKGLSRTAKDDAIGYERKARELQTGVERKAWDKWEEADRAHDRAKANQSRIAKRRAASGTALNEAEKANRVYWRGAYDVRYDTKLARDVQNAKAKARDVKNNPGKYVNKARDSVDQFVNNALSKAKKKKKS